MSNEANHASLHSIQSDGPNTASRQIAATPKPAAVGTTTT
jgi:hypothetical protein